MLAALLSVVHSVEVRAAAGALHRGFIRSHYTKQAPRFKCGVLLVSVLQ